MRHIGTQAFGIRLPIICQGDNLASIVAESLHEALLSQKLTLHSTDVIGITESLVAKAQGNFASVEHIAEDIRTKFPGGEVGIVFPITSRNRFLNILKGIAQGVNKVHILLQFPQDEVGNPILAPEDMDMMQDTGKNFFTAKEFRELTGPYGHPFTGIDYLDLYKNVSDKIEVYVSNDPRRILELTKHVLVGEIHTRALTKKRLLKAGAETVYTLSDVLSSSVQGSGFNPDYGILGSNLSTEDELKLFPRECDAFVNLLRATIEEKCQVAPEVLIYGDGAFKDPVAGIWELADPVVSPAYTNGLKGRPRELKMKFVADNTLKGMSSAEKATAVTQMIREKNANSSQHDYNEGTTPRNYVDLLGSLCDLMSGSGDKGTPVILVQGYFDDFSTGKR